MQKNKSLISVLYLTMNPNRMSTTRPTEGWFKCLIPKGLRPVLVSNKAGEFQKWALEQGIPAYEVSLPSPNKLNPFPFFWSLWQLWRITKKHKIQLIHCNEQNIYPIGQYLGRICRLPVVVSIQFTMSQSFCKWAFRGKRSPRRIFFVSRACLENCRNGLEGIVPESDWRVVYNGLDLTYFYPHQAKRDAFRSRYGLQSNLIIGVTCALRPIKQLEHLFEVASQISIPKLVVLVAGFSMPGYEEYAEKLIEKAKEKLGERLLYVGNLDAEMLSGFYNALDIYVNTSKEEAFSYSILEAMACGCPVIGYPSKFTVSEEILPNGGEIVEQDNIGKLTEALARWLNDPEKLKISRIGARKQAENFDICKISEELWNEYNKLLNL